MGFAHAAIGESSADGTPATWPSGWTWPDGPGGAVPPWPADAEGGATWTFPPGSGGEWDTDTPLPPGWGWDAFPAFS